MAADSLTGDVPEDPWGAESRSTVVDHAIPYRADGRRPTRGPGIPYGEPEPIPIPSLIPSMPCIAAPVKSPLANLPPARLWRRPAGDSPEAPSVPRPAPGRSTIRARG